MKVFTSVNDSDIISLLAQGAVGILRTDTLYGIVGRADNRQAVERIYHLKNRNESKSPIVLIASTAQLFDPAPPSAAQLLSEVWPGKVSVILPALDAPEWLRRENDSIAYRVPADEALQRVLQETGPLVAPSANPEGLSPAMNPEEAYKYFGDKVDFYVDGGTVSDGTPSTLLLVGEDGQVGRLR